MHELGMSSKKPYKKSARVVGEVECSFFFIFNFSLEMSECIAE